MKYAERAGNVYLIDTRMFDFDRYCAAYIVEGQEIALIDTGLPNQWPALQAGIKAHGFSISDISSVFITHGHTDHCGNVARLLKENPAIKVYIHPAGEKKLTDPSGESAKLQGKLLPRMISRFGRMEPVPPSCIQHLKDGDVFDLGNGEKLRIIFAPGHQPSGIVILEEKNGGLFINDLVGLYLADADASIILTPYDSDIKQAVASLRKLEQLPVTRLFLGHFGIHEQPQYVFRRALANMQSLFDIGSECMAKGKPEEIEPRITASKIPEAYKVLSSRGNVMYDYIVEELIPHQSTFFSQYYRENPLS
jgi:glyoxylase-like metal-dependent hydrolase (beta-lactamase superfamily II)